MRGVCVCVFGRLIRQNDIGSYLIPLTALSHVCVREREAYGIE